MILGSLQVRNWRKLGDVDVQALSPRITVIHAPNKTGKTSMVEAVRWALIDVEYDTSRIGPVVPWGTNRIPEVTVAFEVQGKRYLLSKRFTKRKEGGAELHKVRADGELGELLAKDKDVTAKTRELLGVERSDRGVAQLLWVDQGVVALPQIDEELERSLRPLLGSVISGGDLDIRQVLWRRMQAWFTSEQNAARGRHRKGSRLSRAEESIAQREEEVAEINAEFARFEDRLLEVERKEQELAQAKADASAASREVEAVQEADEALVAKRERSEELEGAVEGSKEELSELRGVLLRSQEFGKGAEEARERLGETEAEASPLVKAEKAARKVLDRLVVAREKAEKNVEAVQSRRAVVDAMRRLVEIAKGIDEGKKALGEVDEIEESLQRADVRLAALEAPDKKQLDAIKKRLNRLVELDADLKAGQLSLVVSPTMPGTVSLQVDRQAEEAVALTPGEAVKRAVRQRVRVGIAEFGTVELVRGTEDKSVEQLAAERERLGGELSRLLAGWGVAELEWPEVVPELTRRTTERATVVDEVQKHREKLSELAPDGKGGLERATGALGKERANLLRSHPDLRTWKPSRASLTKGQSEFEGEERERQEALRVARDEEEAARAAMGEAEKKAKAAEARVAEAKTELAKTEALRDSHREEHGVEVEVAQAVEAKQKELGEKETEFERHRLSDDEERVPEQLENGKEALRKRRGRVTSLREQLAHLTGQLQGREGLHARRVTAEQALAAAKREYEEVSVDVDAHRMLLELFDRVRDERVETSIKPVSELVGAWLTELEGPDHYEPTFNSDLSVRGIAVPEAGALSVADGTSYGEREQWATLIRLAYGAVLAEDETQLVILDDPLAHADAFHHRRMLNVIRDAAQRNLQVIVTTSHPERFDHLKGAAFFDLEQAGESAKARK